MKPKFSILTLLGFTAYVAVTLVAIVDMESLIGRARFYFWAILLLWFCIPVPGKNDATIFRRTTMFAALVYMVFALFDYFLLTNSDMLIELPHTLLSRALYKAIPRDVDDWYSHLELTLIPNCALCLGMVVGGIAVWRNRRYERSSQRNSA